ncbi:hypothetical protein GS433_15500 [Rhodococcus hoagii]|uniref:hypothetical protein n=1 Tax=Rhodococcus hoagii TaxID=43767 RepID=UPI0007CD86CF|nr:hypothetical protein [Prescottella equi]MBM4535796.1 hypothetical protein [Prescottella equi]NKR81606.1 hypothetical protein [Prescottella equi]ORL11048.1 hypothetical protein A6I84_03470 [Prescottella equi]
MTFDPDAESENTAVIAGFANELAGLDIAATLTDSDGRADYRRSIPYGRDGQPLHDADRIAATTDSESWFEPDDFDESGAQ